MKSERIMGILTVVVFTCMIGGGVLSGVAENKKVYTNHSIVSIINNTSSPIEVFENGEVIMEKGTSLNIASKEIRGMYPNAVVSERGSTFQFKVIGLTSTQTVTSTMIPERYTHTARHHQCTILDWQRTTFTINEHEPGRYEIVKTVAAK